MRYYYDYYYTKVTHIITVYSTITYSDDDSKLGYIVASNDNSI